MKKQEIDRFIQIAAGGKKMTGEVKRLKEIKPIPLSVNYIKKSDDVAVLPKEKTEQQLYADFLKEKAALKKHYTPFLQNYATKLEDNFTYLTNFTFRKETEKDKTDFTSVLLGEGEWEKVKIPHYVGPDGKWRSFYRTAFKITDLTKDYVLHFEAVDYAAYVYINGRAVTYHEGFFAPFEANITEFLVKGKNELLVAVINDNTTTAVTKDGFAHYGDKIYGATHLGYDEPVLGWHHCPAGAGIHGKVKLIKCNKQRITDIFVRPNIDNGEVTVNTTVYNYDNAPETLTAYYTIEGRNFKGKVVNEFKGKTDPFQMDSNYLSEKFTINNFKLWTLDNPYLYEITVTLKDENGNVVDTAQTHFGMRKFSMDENSKPYKGAFYFNNKRIMLRGTNEMGHLPRAVMENNYDQLIDDILTAKIAGLNFYRMTQRPVFDDIYTYFDMLGMLCQSDFPLFSYLKLSAFGSALKQVTEMERLTRNHPSVVVETFCNETLDKTAWGKEQYNMSRFEIEKFFNAAKEAVELDNPDRVIKYNEGDYAPLPKTHGISDFHCYTFWYISHGMPSGKLRKGYLPPIRKDWMTGCGEYGVDGLDRYELMKKYCPKDWLPKTEKEPWSPKPIAKEQCYPLHGYFFPEEDNIKDWIEASRKWQKDAIKQYVHILRLRSDYVESTAVHLLIDAWPCGWTKTLIDVDRIPKPAFYAFKEANIPLRVSIRRDKFVLYNNDTANVDIYAYNDLPENREVKATVTVYNGKTVIESYQTNGIANGASSTYMGTVKVKCPKNFEGKLTVVAKMTGDEDTFDSADLDFRKAVKKATKTPLILSKTLNCVKDICSGKVDKNIIFVDRDYYLERQKEIEKKVKDGAKVFVNMYKPMNVLGEDIVFRIHTLEEEVAAKNLVYRNKDSEYTKEFNELDFKDFYNKDKDYQDLTAWFEFDWKDAKDILYILKDDGTPESAIHKKHKFIMAEKSYGKGKIILSTVSALQGCIGCNPVLDKLFVNLIEK